jgi:hypothetical protein
MTNTNDITRYTMDQHSCIPHNWFMSKDHCGDYVTYEDHVEALAKARDDALVEASETISGFFAC